MGYPGPRGAGSALLGLALVLLMVPSLFVDAGQTLVEILALWIIGGIAGPVLALRGISRLGAAGRGTPPPPIRHRPGFRSGAVAAFLLFLGLLWFVAAMAPVAYCQSTCPNEVAYHNGTPSSCPPPCGISIGPPPPYPPLLGSLAIEALGAILLGVAVVWAYRSARAGA